MEKVFSMQTRSPGTAGGFTLIEILVTLFVIAIGVLGTASLQAFALKINHSGQLRSQAVILGLNLMERIEANNPAAIAGSYAPVTLPTGFANDCSTAYCSPSELAAYDLVQFRDRLVAQLPGASATITFAGPSPFTYAIRIDWEERISKAASTKVDTSGGTNVTASGMTETFSHLVSKTYYDRSLVI